MIRFSLPTNQYYFGKDAIQGLSEVLKSHKVKTAMITYGGGSVKTIGLYDQVLQILSVAKVQFV